MAKKKKKKSQAFTMIVLLLVIILLAVVYFVAKGIVDRSKEKERAANSNTALIQIDTSTAKTLSYTNNGKEYTFNKINGTWILESEEKRPLNQDKIQNMVDRFQHMTASKTIADNQDNLEAVALDKPALTVTLTLEDGKTYAYSTGKALVSEDGGCYAIAQGFPGVYILPEGYFTMFDGDMNAITAVPSITGINKDNITMIHIIREGEERINVTKDPTKKENAWTITAPYDSSVRMSDSSMALLTALYTNYTFIENVDYDCKDYSQYGLDKPKSLVELKYSTKDKTDNSFTMYIGNNTADGNQRYVRLNDSNSVYTISTVSVNSFTNMYAFGYVADDIIDTQVEDMAKVVVKVKDKTYSLELQGGDSGDSSAVYTLNGVKKEGADVGLFYKKVTSLSIAKPSGKKVDMTDPVCSISVTNKDHVETSYTFYPYDENYYAVEHEGSCYFIIDTRHVDEMIAAIEAL